MLYRIDPVKNLDEADKFLRQAVGTNAYNPDTAYYAAVIALANKRPIEAKALLERSHEDYRSLDDEGRGQSIARTIEQEIGFRAGRQVLEMPGPIVIPTSNKIVAVKQ